MRYKLWIITIILFTILLVGCNQDKAQEVPSQDLDAEEKNELSIEENPIETLDQISLTDIQYDKKLWPEQLVLKEKYAKILDNTVEITLRNGSNGAVYTLTDPEAIEEAIAVIGEMTFDILEDQSHRNGWTYGIECKNQEGDWFSFTLGYAFKDNLLGEQKVVTSPYYTTEYMLGDIEAFETLEIFIQDMENREEPTMPDITVDASTPIGREDYNLYVNNDMIELSQWESNMDLEAILGTPKSVTIEVLENADTFSGSFKKTVVYEGLTMELFSPKDNGEDYWLLSMLITGDGYETYRGIGVGDTFEAIEAAYAMSDFSNYEVGNYTATVYLEGDDDLEF
jgi:hypothetical protein